MALKPLGSGECVIAACGPCCVAAAAGYAALEANETWDDDDVGD